MKVLIVLLTSFAIALFIIKIKSGKYDIALSARIAMSIMLLITAIGHFIYIKGMVMMLPDFIPYKTAMVYVTGIIEILAAIGLHIPVLRVLTGWLLILFFLLILPANIKASVQHIDFQKATMGAKASSYLWFRIPLQILFIVWTYLCAIRGKALN